MSSTKAKKERRSNESKAKQGRTNNKSMSCVCVGGTRKSSSQLGPVLKIGQWRTSRPLSICLAVLAVVVAVGRERESETASKQGQAKGVGGEGRVAGWLNLNDAHKTRHTRAERADGHTRACAPTQRTRHTQALKNVSTDFDCTSKRWLATGRILGGRHCAETVQAAGQKDPEEDCPACKSTPLHH